MSRGVVERNVEKDDEPRGTNKHSVERLRDTSRIIAGPGYFVDESRPTLRGRYKL